jgi:acetate kinase
VIVLVANTGSSSLKLRVVGSSDDVLAAADLSAPGQNGDLGELERFVDGAVELDAVGHRIVHGGDLRESTLVDARTEHRLGELGELAPLHNGPALAVLGALRELRPDLPHVACFDTTFHVTLPPGAALYPVPREWIEQFGLRRFGFHGLSHAWASARTAQLLGAEPTGLRVVTCHLGAGASLAAVAGGRSVDTTMGFTPNEGLAMATRSGSIDPGMLLWLLRRGGLGADEAERALEHEAGLLGLSGHSADMQEVIAAADAGDGWSRDAFAVYLHRLRAGIAAMAAALGGLDALAFTGGVGERSPRVRAEACEGLAFLGVRLDRKKNEDPGADDVDVSDRDASVRTLVVHAREDLQIARAVRAVLDA